jgi:hypothetical protein
MVEKKIEARGAAVGEELVAQISKREIPVSSTHLPERGDGIFRRLTKMLLFRACFETHVEKVWWQCIAWEGEIRREIDFWRESFSAAD